MSVGQLANPVARAVAQDRVSNRLEIIRVSGKNKPVRKPGFSC